MTSVEQTLDRLVSGSNGNTADEPDFIAASTWQGSKPGYYFGTVNERTGYYKDIQQQLSAASASKKPKKSVKIAEDQNEIKILLEKLEEKNKTNHVVTIDLTPKGLRAASKSVQQIYEKNLEQRASGDPQKYMDSELQLYEQLKGLQAVAADPSLYEYILPSEVGGASSLTTTLLQLLGHENTDVCAAVVAVLLEWIDPTLDIDDENTLLILKRLGNLVLQDGWETMVDNLLRFDASGDDDDDDEDENDAEENNLKGIDNTLSLMENLMELDTVIGGLLDAGSEDANTSVAGYMVRSNNAITVSWLLTQIQNSNNEVRRARCLELLAFLSQNVDVFDVIPNWASLPALPAPASNDPNKPPKKKAKISSEPIDGIEILIQIIGQFRKKQPANELQVEMLENACIAMSSCISFSPINGKAFLDAQGVQLLVRCLKERVMAGGVGLKLLDFYGEDAIFKRGAEEIVTAGGFKYIFPLLLGTRIPKPVSSTGNDKLSTKEKREWINMIKEQIIRVFFALTFQLDDQSPDEAKPRFLAKFVEDDLKYCDRLVELLLEYDERARKAEYNFYRAADAEEETMTEGELALAAFDAKLKGGGDIYHRAAAITAYVCVNSRRCHERVLRQLEMKQSGISLIKAALTEFESFLKSDSRQRGYIQELLDKI